jgi:ubiquitin-associated SH3 domain-containing protein
MLRYKLILNSFAGPRRLFILRHAERVDVTFGKQWIQLSFDPDGYYHRRNLNMPKEVPQRKGGPNDFLKDAPVTEVGLFQARLTGEGMRDQGIRISHVFSSPALRCVQTAHAILQGLGEPGAKIRIENGLFEWLAWCQGGFPTFMTPNDFLKNGLQVDPTYLSQVALNDLKPKETHLEFYKRMYNITRLILKTLGQSSGNVMFVGHAASLEACTRQLVGAQPRSAQELTKMVQKIPYLGMCVAQESEYGKNSTWDFIDPPIPPLTHAPNIRFDWRCLQ